MSVKKITMALAVVAVCALSALAQKPGSVISIDLDDGNEAILAADSTWSFKRPPLQEPKDDIFITLRDNRILWLKTDYTYTFTKTMPKEANVIRIKNAPAIAVTGQATNPDLDAALKGAMADAYKKASDMLRKQMPPKIPKDAPTYITACLKQEFKENEVDQSQTQGKGGWTATAKIDISSYRVRKVADCIELQLEGK